MASTDDDLRKQARKRLEKRRDFSAHLVAYVFRRPITEADIERGVDRGEGRTSPS